ncbi:hypothetical protein ES705_48086 [subsurface metagenome]
MDEKDIEKNKKLIDDISNLNKIRQYKIVEDIDKILEELEGD